MIVRMGEGHIGVVERVVLRVVDDQWRSPLNPDLSNEERVCNGKPPHRPCLRPVTFGR